MGEGEKGPNKDPLSPLTRDKKERGEKGGASKAIQIGDPSSLKAETVDHDPTEDEGGAEKTDPENQKDSTGPSHRSVPPSSSNSTATKQTPTGDGNSKKVGGAVPPSSLQKPPLEEENMQKRKQSSSGGNSKL